MTKETGLQVYNAIKETGANSPIVISDRIYVQHDCSAQYDETVEFLQSRIERSFHGK